MPHLIRLVRRSSLAAATALLLCAGLAACAKSKPDLDPTQASTTVGDAEKGAALINRVGCGSCHVIPGVLEADGMVGPPLDHIGSRQYLAGMLRNTPDDMVTWLRFPQRIVPGNAMPDMGLSQNDAQDIAAYLETLK
jgi:cytochrome c2